VIYFLPPFLPLVEWHADGSHDQIRDRRMVIISGGGSAEKGRNQSANIVQAESSNKKEE
jgi:hypothetical protein